ncbi:hypothetical protein [Amycolatopsis pigmentata]|uniref:Uncharacterized protein n=1 Tax=Amycolatopsis pigmentata TaxID=450801 RepID=A0ABW5FJ04_9PSEU
MTIYSSELDLPDEIYWGALKVGPIVTVEAITLALRRANMDGARLRSVPRRRDGQTGAPFGSAGTKLLDSLDAVVVSRSERAFEQWFSEVLDTAGVPHGQSPTVQSGSRTLRLDFVSRDQQT